jgi:hypothetical protein
MKKLLVLTTIFALALAACSDGDMPINGNNNSDNNNNNNNNNNTSGNNSDVIGTWTGNYGTGNAGVLTLSIADDYTWIITFKDTVDSSPDSFNSGWSRSGNSLTLEHWTGHKIIATITNNKLILTLTSYFTNSYRPGSIELTKSGSTEGPGGTPLKIQNDSFSEITEVKWGNILFTQGAESIRNNGQSVTKNVQEDSQFIYFKRKTDPINARTDERITVEKNDPRVFILNDNTIIVDVDNPGNRGTFGTLGVKRGPQITVQAGATNISHFGDYDFGGVLLNTDRDVTFTIGNSGKADLEFNVVEGNVINLSNNASGYFSVVQQPFASMKITPEGKTTFIIRFSPKTVGNNFNTEVTIATNSENNAEFTFRIKGNGSNEYQIGDTGPGGGMIFYAEGGQYKECSGELGSYNWNDAMSTAQNYKGGGFTNWHLPDNGELDLMYQNLHKKNLGGFSNVNYWSSTEYSSVSSCIQNFSNGTRDYYSKSNLYRVRAVRAFTL